MTLIQCNDIKQAFQQAIATAAIGKARAKERREERKIVFWPSEIHISSLAYVVSRVESIDTALCALGIGMQIPRFSTPAMRKGTDIHGSLLPIVAELLGGQCEVSVRAPIQDVLVVGSADLVVGDTVIEVKTGTFFGNTNYAVLQASLYAHFLCLSRQILVMIRSDNMSVFVEEVERSPLLSVALKVINQYAQKRHLQPQGECDRCLLFDLCNTYPANWRKR